MKKTNLAAPQQLSPQDWIDPQDLYQIGAKMNTGRLSTRGHVWRPPTDVYELDAAVVVRIEIAGLRDKDFSITIQDQFLIVRGSRGDTPERRAYYQMEIRYGEFGVEIQLPSPVLIDEAQAEYRHGFLVIVLPKQQPKQIPISEQ
jgi:HSP20 family protein